jgi:hypothetical protein
LRLSIGAPQADLAPQVGYLQLPVGVKVVVLYRPTQDAIASGRRQGYAPSPVSAFDPKQTSGL